MLFLVLAALRERVVIFLIKLLVFSLIKSIAYFLHKLIIEIEIMKNGKTHSKCLASLEKMADIGS